MTDNEWMYSGRVSSTQVTDDWKWKTNFLVKELARGSKGVVDGAYRNADFTLLGNPKRKV